MREAAQRHRVTCGGIWQDIACIRLYLRGVKKRSGENCPTVRCTQCWTAEPSGDMPVQVSDAGFPVRVRVTLDAGSPLVYSPYFTAQKMKVKMTVKMTQTSTVKGCQKRWEGWESRGGDPKSRPPDYPVGCFFRRTRRSYCPSRGRHVKPCLPEAGAAPRSGWGARGHRPLLRAVPRVLLDMSGDGR